ncbi:MAG: DUF5906 domain-containing protein [Sulfitobacter sp.]
MKNNTARALPDQELRPRLADLAEAPVWAAWQEEMQNGRWTKPPRNPKTGGFAKTNNPNTWENRATAQRRADGFETERAKGVGVMLAPLPEQPGWRVCGIDLDGCRDPETGEIAAWGQAVVTRFDSYADVSPSGTGGHVLFLAWDKDIERLREEGLIRQQPNGAPGAGRAFALGEHTEIALFVERKFLTVTGDMLGKTDELRPVTLEILRWLLENHGPSLSVDLRKDAAAEVESRADASGSGYGFRFMLAAARRGATEEKAREEIEVDTGDAGEWWARVGGRQRDRAVERAFSQVHAEQASLLDDLPDDDAAGLSVEEHAEIDDLVGATTTDSASKLGKPKVDRATARMNERHAVVRHGAKTWIADFTGEQIELGPVEGIHALYANDLVPAGVKGAMVPVSKHWITSPGRRTYHSIVFDPGGSAPKSALNLYSGLAVQPDLKGSCEKIVAHVRDVIAAGNEAHFRYVIGWLADLVQNPGRKPGVALVLRGGKGVGKDTLAEIMGRIIGRKHVAHIIRADDLTGRFNAPFATALLVHVEEAFWSGDVSKKGTLQALITARTQPIERKGVDRIEVESFLRVLMTTNDEWAVPASEDERRYAAFDVSDVHQRKAGWFGPLYDEIEGGGPAAFLAYLLSVDLAGFDVRDVPQTEALRDQKIASLRGVELWWFEVLEKGDAAEFEAFGDWSDPITVKKEAVRASYKAALRERRFGGDPVVESVFTKDLKRLLGDELAEKRPRVDGTPGPRVFVFPSLTECRAKFERWLGAPVQWGDADAGVDDDPEAVALI